MDNFEGLISELISKDPELSSLLKAKIAKAIEQLDITEALQGTIDDIFGNCDFDSVAKVIEQEMKRTIKSKLGFTKQPKTVNNKENTNG
jgi:hypothetical protein